MGKHDHLRPWSRGGSCSLRSTSGEICYHPRRFSLPGNDRPVSSSVPRNNDSFGAWRVSDGGQRWDGDWIVLFLVGAPSISPQRAPSP